jgi:hypothetical protein
MGKVFEYGNYDKLEIPKQVAAMPEPKVGELWYVKRSDSAYVVLVRVENITPKVVQFREHTNVITTRSVMMKRADVEFVEKRLAK